MEQLQGVIFDMDGTLVDSMKMWAEFRELYVQKQGILLSPQQKEKLYTFDVPDALHYITQQFGLSESPEELRKLTYEIIFQKYEEEEIKVKNHVVSFLGNLRDAGVALCVASATKGDVVRKFLKRIGLFSYFDAVVTCDEVGKGKTDPLVYFTALEKIGTDQAHTIIFEDAEYAIQTAKQAGFFVAGVQDDWTPDQEKIRKSSDWYITSFDIPITFYRKS